MKNYTIGIYFDSTLKKVALILKNRPVWQAGRYNCMGGHIEENESPIDCVIREFKEECGIDTILEDWKHIGCIKNELNYKVEVFTAIQNDSHGNIESLTDEKVSWFGVDNLPENMILNLRWLIPFAINIWEQEKSEHLCFGVFEYTLNND